MTPSVPEPADSTTPTATSGHPKGDAYDSFWHLVEGGPVQPDTNKTDPETGAAYQEFLNA
jgi:hypothetical protein